MTKDRTRLATDKYESCAMVSHESRRRYCAANKCKMMQLLPKAEAFLKTYRATHAREALASKKRVLVAKEKGGRKKRAKK